jgi:hypothetical protein
VAFLGTSALGVVWPRESFVAFTDQTVAAGCAPVVFFLRVLILDEAAMGFVRKVGVLGGRGCPLGCLASAQVFEIELALALDLDLGPLALSLFVLNLINRLRRFATLSPYVCASRARFRYAFFRAENRYYPLKLNK